MGDNQIKVISSDGKLVVTSRQIAVDFEKRHDNVLRAIKEKIEMNSILRSEKYFIEDSYVDRGKVYKEYLLTRDGFSFLVMGFTGFKADEWKLKYIEAFNSMENMLSKNTKPLSAMEMMELQFKALKEVSTKVEEVENKFEELPLFMADSKSLKKLANRIIVGLLGGKKANAYKPMSKKVYSDLYGQVHREFQVAGVDEIKRKDLDLAKDVITNYKLPLALQKEIDKFNNQSIFEVC